MVHVQEIDYSQYLTILRAEPDKQMNIVRIVMQNLRTRGKTVPFRIGGEEYSAVDTIEGMGYRDAGRNWAEKLLSGQLNKRVERILVGALRALALTVEKYPAYAAGAYSGLVFYAPKHAKLSDSQPLPTYTVTIGGTTIESEDVRFLVTNLQFNQFIEHIGQTRIAFKLAEKVLRANKSLLKAKVNVTSSSARGRRGNTFGKVWTDMVNIVNLFPSSKQSEWRVRLSQLVVFGQQEVDQFVAGQVVLAKLLNKIIATPELAQSVETPLRQLISNWPFPGAVKRGNTIYLPFDVLDATELPKPKAEFAAKMRATMLGIRTQLLPAHAREYDRFAKDVNIALSGTLDFASAATLFFKAIERVQKVAPQEAATVLALADKAEIRP